MIQVEKKHIESIGSLQTKNSALQEKYIAVLRELRDKLQAIRLDDFLKVIIGLMGGYVVRAASQQGLEAIKDPVVGYASLLFIICFIFLIMRYFLPTKRKQEIKIELEKLNNRDSND